MNLKNKLFEIVEKQIDIMLKNDLSDPVTQEKLVDLAKSFIKVIEN